MLYKINKLDDPLLRYLQYFIIILCRGGDKRIRTADICLAKAALYQLSYTPFLPFKYYVHKKI